jgi:hypothetical protein
MHYKLISIPNIRDLHLKKYSTITPTMTLADLKSLFPSQFTCCKEKPVDFMVGKKLGASLHPKGTDFTVYIVYKLWTEIVGIKPLAKELGVPATTFAKLLVKLGIPTIPNTHATRLKKLEPAFAAAHSERMQQLHRDPVFAAQNAKNASETITRLNKDPKFAKKHRVRISSMMKERHKDPVIAKEVSVRMIALNQDPVFQEKRTAGRRSRSGS